ncbi:MAG: hypothetical protein AB1656_19615 [Candidatus Omnitrophota bacterium]
MKIQTKNERFLAGVTVALAVGFAAYFSYKTIGEKWFNLNEELDGMKGNIQSQLQIQDEAIQITARFEEMEKELKLEGSDTEQELKIRGDLTSIFDQLGLKGQRIQPNQARKEDDFKIVSYDINDIECSPDQLGQLLYLIEKKMEIIEVETCRITNQMQDNGYLSRRRDLLNPVAGNGLLSVDLQISRLVEYRKGEAPKKRGTQL